MDVLRLEVIAEGVLQSGAVARGKALIRDVIVAGDIDIRPPFEMARKEELALRLARLFEVGRQHLRESFGGARRRTGASTFSDETNHCVAVVDIVGKRAQQRLAIGILLKITLDRHFVITRPQISGKRVARLAEFASYG